jgi:hypothetical protein
MNQSSHPASSESHRVRLLMLLLPLLLAGVSLAWVREPQTQIAPVLGEVMNGTPGGRVPDDLAVTLHLFSDMEETSTYTTTLMEDHSFRFEEVCLEEGHTVVARVVYEGVTYVSEFATVEQGRETLSLPVTIYETTQDLGEISITQLHLFVNQVSERIQIGTYLVIGNAGSRTYVGTPAEGASTTWSAQLPEGAENLQFDGAQLEGRFVALDGGFADTRPIPPGGASVETSFTHEMNFREGMEIRQSFDVPVRAAVLVLPEGDWRLQGAKLTSEGRLDTQMGAALSYTAGPLSANELLSFTIVPGASGPSRTPEGTSTNGVVFGIAALVMAGVAIAFMWRKPSPGPVPVEMRAQVEAIAALDREFESGRLPEKRYREKRRSLKRRLRQTLSG